MFRRKALKSDLPKENIPQLLEFISEWRTSQPSSERVTEAEGKMHVLNWQAVYFIPNARRQIATWVSMHQNVIKSESRALTFFTAGACTEFYSECFCLFAEKIVSTLSKSQARQHM